MAISKTEVLKALKEVAVMSVAINSQEYPVATMVLFTVDEELNFYFMTHGESYKAKALEKDQRVSWNVWQQRKMLVQGSGTATQIADEEEKRKILVDLAKSAAEMPGFWPPVLRIQGGEYTVYRVKPVWLRALDLSNMTIVDGNGPFTEVELTKKV